MVDASFLPPEIDVDLLEGDTHVLSLPFTDSAGAKVNISGFTNLAARCSILDAQLTAAVEDSDTEFSVSNPLWLWPLTGWPRTTRVGHEILTITAVAGNTDTQTLTVTRGTGGVATAHDELTVVPFIQPLPFEFALAAPADAFVSVLLVTFPDVFVKGSKVYWDVRDEDTDTTWFRGRAKIYKDRVGAVA